MSRLYFGHFSQIVQAILRFNHLNQICFNPDAISAFFFPSFILKSPFHECTSVLFQGVLVIDNLRLLLCMELNHSEISSILTCLLFLVRMNLWLMLVRKLGCSMQHFETISYSEINSILTCLLFLVRMNLWLMLVRKLGCSMQHFETISYSQNHTMHKGESFCALGLPLVGSSV